MFSWNSKLVPLLLLTNLLFHQFLHKKKYEAKFNVDCFEDENSGKTKFVELEKDDYFFFATMINQLFIISAIFAQKRIWSKI